MPEPDVLKYCRDDRAMYFTGARFCKCGCALEMLPKNVVLEMLGIAPLADESDMEKRIRSSIAQQGDEDFKG